MRLWSIHPKYLDTKGLVALWREALLAKAVLEGKTEGYKNHPQLLRFKKSENPVNNINFFLQFVYEEAVDRGFRFNKEKIDILSKVNTVTVTDMQIEYEKMHLLKKLQKRDKAKFDLLSSLEKVSPHPMFTVLKGEIEHWEVMKDSKLE